VLVTGSSLAVLSGRDFTTCVKSCNAIRKTCDSLCKPNCWDLFPDDKTQRDACIAACKAICLQESDECKLVCQEIKNPPSPEVP